MEVSYSQHPADGVNNQMVWMGKSELRPAVKKLYQLGPEVFAPRVSVASRVVNNRHDELRPAVSKEWYQMRRKTWVYRMSNNWKVLTGLVYFTLYTIICTHTELLNDIDSTEKDGEDQLDRSCEK